jgi:hypothetical protein
MTQEQVDKFFEQNPTVAHYKGPTQATSTDLGERARRSSKSPKAQASWVIGSRTRPTADHAFP